MSKSSLAVVLATQLIPSPESYCHETHFNARFELCVFDNVREILASLWRYIHKPGDEMRAHLNGSKEVQDCVAGAFRARGFEIGYCKYEDGTDVPNWIVIRAPLPGTTEEPKE